MRRVVVTGLGALTPLGVGARRTWQRLLASESGLVSVADGHGRGRDAAEQAQWRDLTSTVAGIVPTDSTFSKGHDDGLWRPADWLDAADQRRMSTFAQYAVAAAEMALRDAGWRPTREEEHEMTGVCLGSGIGNLHDFYATSVAFDQGTVGLGVFPGWKIGLQKGLASVCAQDLDQPRRGAYCHALRPVGAEPCCDYGVYHGRALDWGRGASCIHPLTFAGFGRSRSLSTAFNHDPPASCRPFDAGRAGFVVAEGAAVVILEELEHAKRRGARILAELKGYGCSGDAHHMTAPREDGSGALSAMKRALKNAGVKPAQVDYINAHATGTLVGDAAEAAAIRTLMMGEDGVEDESKVTVSSTKGAIGHLLGAAGAIEAVFSILAITEKFNLKGTLLGRVGESLATGKSSYYIYKATENMYKACAAQADYAIEAADRKAGKLQTTADGEEIGASKGGPWHDDLALLPTFSTWAHVTMLHMYLLVVRFRCLDPAAQQAWQAPLVNHFFYHAEAKMEDVHELHSRLVRQTYLKDLFVQWRGLMLAYDEGIVKGDAVLASAVWRNLFKAREDVDVRALAAVVAWMRAGLRELGEMADEDVEVAAVKAFPDVRAKFSTVDVPAASIRPAFGRAGVHPSS
ncbi:thiolase-like protein [Parachaetomium inaequale]|uniref:beta-ketoacyl-[acyl-carrier-protein] synthase I n=1 Tax=Parachaetomium inaequale TaxID=2588326 RepID=A0AAN6PND6_9PEZI|nr:thiolase-like protein [Parachaetomium inaequale]